MKNLLDSTDVAILFLDSDLLVRRFTTETCEVMRLQASDVGRRFTDLVCDLDYPDMASAAGQVLRTAEPHEREVRATGDRWFRVRMIAYHTRDGAVDGVVTTFVDITRAKTLEFELRGLKAKLEDRVADQRDALIDAQRQLDDEQRKQP
jgi:transcriptional regulator with PAS, ATPase and Fis domain